MHDEFLPTLFWDSAFAVAVILIEQYPDVNPELIGLEELVEMVIHLPGFADDPALVNDRLLEDILIAWYEEINST